MVSWNAFVRDYVKEWRDSFERLSEEQKAAADESWHSLYYFLKPVQIQVFTFEKPPEVLWVITHYKNRGDIEIKVNPRIDSDIFSYFKEKKDPEWYEQYDQILASGFLLEGNPTGNLFGFDKNKEFWYAIYGKSVINDDP